MQRSELLVTATERGRGEAYVFIAIDINPLGPHSSCVYRVMYEIYLRSGREFTLTRAARRDKSRSIESLLKSSTDRASSTNIVSRSPRNYTLGKQKLIVTLREREDKSPVAIGGAARRKHFFAARRKRNVFFLKRSHGRSFTVDGYRYRHCSRLKSPYFSSFFTSIRNSRGDPGKCERNANGKRERKRRERERKFKVIRGLAPPTCGNISTISSRWFLRPDRGPFKSSLRYSPPEVPPAQTHTRSPFFDPPRMRAEGRWEEEEVNMT